MLKNDPYKATKLEKTGDRSFNVHTAGGGHFECTTKKNLSEFSGVKNVNHTGPDGVVAKGIGEKKPLACDACGRPVSKVRGYFMARVKKFFYVCDDCGLSGLTKNIEKEMGR